MTFVEAVLDDREIPDAELAAFRAALNERQERAAVRDRVSQAREAAFAGPLVAWLLQRIADLRIERARARWRRYSTSDKGRARRRAAQARYADTTKGRIAVSHAQLQRGCRRRRAAIIAKRTQMVLLAEELLSLGADEQYVADLMR